MTDKSKKGNPISRRGILPILGSSLLIPFFGMGKPLDDALIQPEEEEEEEEFQTLLKPDGTTVKVSVDVLKNSKIIKKNINNKSFLQWLGKKN